MKWLITAFQLLPSVFKAITEIEASIEAPGATKKGIIMGAISSAAQVGEQIPDKTTALISAFIDNTVQQLNASGVFTHKSVTAPAS